MSLSDRLGRDDRFDRLREVDLGRTLALVAVLVTLGASLQVLYHFIDVVGLPIRFLAVATASFVAATALARVLRPRRAVAIGAFLFLVGLGWYLSTLTDTPTVGALIADIVRLSNGQSLLQIMNIRAWVLGVTPGPVFLTWYFAVRRWYTPAVTVAIATLGFLVLTGDADVVTTATGVIAAGAALGLGDLDRRDEPVTRADMIPVVVAAMIVVPSVVSVVPAAGASGPLAPDFEREQTVEASLLNTDEDLTIQGSITLSPKVRFTVTSGQGRYWRVGSFDRYTGSGWVRTGGSREYDGERLRSLPGPTQTVDQTFRVESQANVMPAAWKAVDAWGVDTIRVRADGSLEPGDTLERNQVYSVQSQVHDATPQLLRNAGTDYPDVVVESHTQLPESTPARVEQRTARLTADAESPYEKALVIQRWLRNNKNYSLDVDRPRGDVADAFLFQMDAGYCTYYATTMVTMLRTQGIPARFVVGYTPGERVAEDQWVVRGLDSHAWVEVYFPDYGWVKFDPTPTEPRSATADRLVQSARDRNLSSIDTGRSGTANAWNDTPTPVSRQSTVTNDSVDAPALFGPVTPGANSTGLDVQTRIDPSDSTPFSDLEDLVPEMPSRQQLALALVALFGTAVGLRRSQVGERAYRTIWLRYQPRDEPAADVERAFQRLLYHLEQNHDRSRRADETVREYLDALDADPAVRRVAEIRERARYRGTVDQEVADEAVQTVHRIVR